MSLEIDNMSNRGKLGDETIDQLFSRLKAEDIEQFYMAYQLWSQRQQIERLQLQMLGLQQKIDENTTLMEQFQPSAVALASLAQLQACGVEDTDLLERMLERGEEWLDHSIQLLERCEQLDLIGGDYTQWCEHALEGAYDWIDSMTDSNIQEAETTALVRQESTISDEAEVTEELLLKKLMSEEGEKEKAGQQAEQNPRITQPLAIFNVQEDIEDNTQKVAVIKPVKSATQPLPAVDEQININEQTNMDEVTQQVVVTGQPTDEQVKTSSSTLATTETDQNLNMAADNTNTTEISQEEHPNQDLSPSKKGMPKKKKGFLLRFLTKFMR